jgi:hypothetical protein
VCSHYSLIDMRQCKKEGRFTATGPEICLPSLALTECASSRGHRTTLRASGMPQQGVNGPNDTEDDLKDARRVAEDPRLADTMRFVGSRRGDNLEIETAAVEVHAGFIDAGDFERAQ